MYKLSNSFLGILWRRQKILFFGVLIFLLGQIFFSYKGVETFPFFNYGMYSAKFTTKDSLTVPRMHVNDEPFSPYTYAKLGQSFLQYNLHYYHRFKRQDYQDPIIKTINSRFGKDFAYRQYLSNDKAAAERFFDWYYRYIQQAIQQPIGQLAYYEYTYVFEQQRFKLVRKTKHSQIQISQ